MGEAGCPAGSQVGTGTARTVLPDGTVLNFTQKIYAAGADELTLSLTTDLFQIALPAQISGQIVTADIPGRVQQPAPGLYASVTNVGVTIGPNKSTVKKTIKVTKTVRRNGKKKKIRVKKTVKAPVYIATITGCPGGSRTYGVDLHLVPNPTPPAQENIGATATAAC